METKAIIIPNIESQVKESWNKPEMEVLSVKDETLNNAFFGDDGGSYS